MALRSLSAAESKRRAETHDAIDRRAFQQQPDMGREVGVAEPGQGAAALLVERLAPGMGVSDRRRLDRHLGDIGKEAQGFARRARNATA